MNETKSRSILVVIRQSACSFKLLWILNGTVEKTKIKYILLHSKGAASSQTDTVGIFLMLDHMIDEWHPSSKKRSIHEIRHNRFFLPPSGLATFRLTTVEHHVKYIHNVHSTACTSKVLQCIYTANKKISK